MKDLFFTDINSALILRHYDNKLLLVSGNKIKFYTYEEIKKVVRAQNIAIYGVDYINKNEKIVHISNNVKLKCPLRISEARLGGTDIPPFDNDSGIATEGKRDHTDKGGNTPAENATSQNAHEGDPHNGDSCNGAPYPHSDNLPNGDATTTGESHSANNTLSDNPGKKGNTSKGATNHVCIAFEHGNVCIFSEDEANKEFIYEKLIYRKVCDIVKIEMFAINNNLNCLILYRDYTLILYKDRYLSSVKLPTHEYAYNFCLSTNYQNMAVFNHSSMYIYDLSKKDLCMDGKGDARAEGGAHESSGVTGSGVNDAGGSGVSGNNGSTANDATPNNCVEVKNIFDLSKNYKNILNCDWHPKNHCISLCGKKAVRYLTIYNYKVYEFSGEEIHESFINATKFITISDNVILLTTLSCADCLFCVWEFELEYCLYKFKSEYLISHFDLSYYNDHLHMSMLAQEKHLANVKLLGKKILQKIEWNDSEKEASSAEEEHQNEGSNWENSTAGKPIHVKQNVNNIADILKDNNNYHVERKKKLSVKSTSTFPNERSKMSSELRTGSNDKRRNSDSYSGDLYLHLNNVKKRKKKIFTDDDEESKDAFINMSHKKVARDRDAHAHADSHADEQSKREDKQDEYYEGRKADKDSDYQYNSDENEKRISHGKRRHANRVEEDNEYNPKEYNLQDFINKNRDVIRNSSKGGQNGDPLFEDSNYLFDNEDEQKSVTGFNTYVKDKFDQLRELKKEVDLLQKQISGYTKINHDDFIVLCPGLCEEPENINDQWCMFWNDIGHITKKKEGNKTYIYVYLFRGEDVGKKKITDIYNVTAASLSAYGFALASNPYEKSFSKINSILCFHNLRDNVIWNKYLPNDEFIKGVANGNNFVAIVTSSNFLRIYSTYGYIINTFLLKGLPVAICAYDYLLFVITCQYIFEGVSTYNINNVYNCTLYKINENFTNLKTNKYNTYHITVLHNDVLSLPSCHYLNWVNMSNFGIPYVRDTSNFIYGLYPLFKSSTNHIVYDWVPVFDFNNLNKVEPTERRAAIHSAKQMHGNMKGGNKNTATDAQQDEDENDENEPNPNGDNPDDDLLSDSECTYYPLYFDNFEQISVIKLYKNEIEPRSNKIESCLGYNVEKKYILSNECNLIKYERFVKLIQTNPNLSLDNDSSSSEFTSLPWEQYDELRSRVDLFCKQLFANIHYDYMNDGKNKSASDTLKSLNKLYDKWIMRMFAILKNDKKNQKLAVKTSRLFKNIKNMMLSISLVDDEYSTLHSEITNEYLKRQIKDESYKNFEENLHYDEDYKDDEQKRKEIYEKYYHNNQHLSEDEKKNLPDVKQTNQQYVNAAKTQVEHKEKKESGFLDKFFTGVTKNQSVDNLFSQEKKTTQIKKKNTLESFFSELKEN
ncbi:MCL1 domain-containing protein, putative [Plasmodium vivax]|uniref:MCL1 domain-containing protein, putative n=1 Tax=Plasmodium vivax TaxID=5855 RepID=A0A565A1J3_PLAVI|nr:MCL1 domain-containing protein, putative [Plasmodium vivax]